MCTDLDVPVVVPLRAPGPWRVSRLTAYAVLPLHAVRVAQLLRAAGVHDGFDEVGLDGEGEAHQVVADKDPAAGGQLVALPPCEAALFHRQIILELLLECQQRDDRRSCFIRVPHR